MDTNLVLLWTVAAWWLLGVRNAVVLARQGRPAWLLAYALVAVATGLMHWLRPAAAGLAGAATYALLILAPAFLQRRVTRLSGLQQYADARRTAAVAAFLHPADGYPDLVGVLAAMSSAREGRIAEAERELTRIAQEGNPGIRNLAALYLFRMRGDWALYLRLTDSETENERDRMVTSEPSFFVGRLRALGEVGRIEELIAMYGKHAARLSSPALVQVRASAQLFVAAFAGEPKLVQRLIDASLGPLDEHSREYWLAVAQYFAGDVEAARARLRNVAQSAEPVVARAAQRRLEAAVPERPSLSAAAERQLAALEAELAQEHKYGDAIDLTFKPRATHTLVALNLLGFALELLLGGSDEGEALYRAGAVFTHPELAFQWSDSWRVLTALFLHAGVLHLAMNMFALVSLGPFVERNFGRARFILLYLASGIVGAAWTAMRSSDQPELFLGASGCIMGLVGATAAAMVHGKREGSPVASQRLSRIALLLVMQVAFDLSVPGISLIAHWSGVAVGFVLGYALTFTKKVAQANR